MESRNRTYRTASAPGALDALVDLLDGIGGTSKVPSWVAVDRGLIASTASTASTARLLVTLAPGALPPHAADLEAQRGPGRNRLTTTVTARCALAAADRLLAALDAAGAITRTHHGPVDAPTLYTLDSGATATVGRLLAALDSTGPALI